MRTQFKLPTASIAIAAMVLVTAVISRAQSVDLGFNQTVPTQCSSGESVALTGNLHLAMSAATTTDDTTTPPTVTNHYNVTIASSLTGAGQSSKTVYAEKSSYAYDFPSPDSSVQFTLQLQGPLISPGGSPVMVLQRSLQINLDNQGNISGSVVSSSSSCADSAN